MRLEISYRGGTTHEVELPGSVCVLGRDPGCDVVLNDSKCSRRHAIVEEDREGGLVVRDSGSANGIYLNGRRVEECSLRPGDTLRLGDVQVRLLAEVGETVIVAPDDLDLRTGAGAAAEPRPPAPDLPLHAAIDPVPARGGRRAPPREPAQPRRVPQPVAGLRARPATVSVLVGLWALFVPASVAACLFAAARLGGGAVAWTLGALGSVALAGLGASMALGLRALAPWARHLQVATAAIGLLACPFTLAAATVLLYMTRPDVKAVFEGNGGAASRAGSETDDATFALSIAGMLVLGLALAAVAVLLL
jgi:hypothetical protein